MDKVLIKQAYLHTPIHIPGVGQTDHNLPPGNKTLANTKLYRLDDGSVELEWGAGNTRNHYVVNSATVKGCLLVPTHVEVVTDKT